MIPCVLCGEHNASAALQVCAHCIKTRFDEALPFIQKTHQKIKKEYMMPETPPQQGTPCGFCVNNCRIPEGEYGYCGTRKNTGTIVNKTGSPDTAYVECYHDPLPTNCVSMDFCGGRNDTGKNLAVFYGACTFNCLFCQNWHYRRLTHTMHVKDVLSYIDKNTACICYFGGDPTPQIEHALKVADHANHCRICWETNGAFSHALAKKIGKTSFDSGGTIKIDIKAYSEKIHYALTGSSNKNTLSNFEYIYSTHPRKDPPMVVASTLLVPGYIDVSEISAIAQFISDIDPHIPYCLLGFHPHFKMKDLPYTSKDEALACVKEAQKYVSTVRIGNVWLLR
ncbi:MAG: radical SAM protein [Candidatus Methanofastidiosia archaeon]|jgi:pyruvate formate lyase activating enzyme